MNDPLKRKTRVAEPDAPVMIRAEHISKKFGNIQALNDVSFQLRKCEILGLLGPNGAGKTTAMRILSGYFPPAKGKVWIGGQDLFDRPEHVKRLVGYLPESASFYGDMRVAEFLDFAAKLKGLTWQKHKAELDGILERCGLWDVRTRLIGQLSKGFRQRLGLAQALLGDPEVLLLDEPTSGLDPKQIKEIRNLIRELGRNKTLILSTHILPEVSMVCDRVLILNEGKVIASGTSDELEAGLQKCHEVVVSVGERHRKEEVEEYLKALANVERVNVLEEKGDQISFSLLISKGAELRPAITRWFVEHEIPLLELRTGRLSLEEIFLKIVVNENSHEGQV